MASHGSRGTRATATAFLLAAFVGLLATACGGGGGDERRIAEGTLQRNVGAIESDETPQPGGKLVYGLIAETNGWNPSSSQWAPSGLQVAHTFFDTLAAFDADLNIHPFAAESFTPSADYKQWVIRLRPGMTFHNGSPVTADAVRQSFDFLKSSTLTRDAFEQIESFETRSELELVVNTKNPWVNYPMVLATQIGVITEPNWLRSGDVRNPIGSGPFIFESWEANASLRVRKNPNYWQRGYPLLDEVEFRPIPDGGTRSQSLEAGTINIMQITDPQHIRRFLEQGGTGEFQVFSDTRSETAEVFVQLNTTEPPFDDPEARRALAYATNSQELVDSLYGGLFQVARGPFAPSSPWYTETDYPRYDEQTARELVEKVKARNGGKFEFTLISSATPGVLEAIQFLKQRWEELGITVRLDTLQQLELILRVISGQYQATMWQQFDYPHPIADTIWWHPNAARDRGDTSPSLNFARNKNPRIGEYLDQARAATDKDEEKRLYQEVQKELAKDVPYVFLYHTQIAVIASSRVVNVVNYKLPDGAKGIELQQGFHPLYQVWIRR